MEKKHKTAVFSLTTDSHFVRTWASLSSLDVFVHQITGDPYDIEIVRAKDCVIGESIQIGPSIDSNYKALEVHGVKIHGHLLTQLVNDLTLTAPDGQTFHLAVNRQGFCYLFVNSASIKRLRINDYFDWSKYGVKPQMVANATIWNRCNMGSGVTIVDVGKSKKAEEELREALNEKRKELEDKVKEVAVMRKLLERNDEMEAMWKKSLEEKDKELSLKTQLLERSKEVESMLKKSLEDKDEQLNKLMDAMRALVS
ncbi:hypothetical protein LINPERPRIM_LOCUS25973 [Linum perenne]